MGRTHFRASAGAIETSPFDKSFMVHCVGGCSRGEWRNLTGIKPSEVTCNRCGSARVAVWIAKVCVYSYRGYVEYPMMSGSLHGARVPGSKMSAEYWNVMKGEH